MKTCSGTKDGSQLFGVTLCLSLGSVETETVKGKGGGKLRRPAGR